MLPGKGDQMLARRSFGQYGKILPFRKEMRMIAAKAQRLPYEIELDTPVFLFFNEFRGGLGQVDFFPIKWAKAVEQAAAQVIVHRPAIVGINQTEVPEFCPLINIGDSR